MGERLQKAMARAGVGSRRRCEELIREGRVRVDGRVATIGTVVDDRLDRITVDGQPLRLQALEYWLLNKRAGTVCTARDPQGRPTVVDGLPTRARVYPVGRLDWDTTGLLLLTNDGELALRLSHPRYGVEKEYVVGVRGYLTDRELRALREGVPLEDGITARAAVSLLSRSDSESVVRLVIHEGRNRQVRRMIEAVGHSVVSLHRLRIDGLEERGLLPGAFRRLTQAEVRRLRAAVGLS